MDQQGKYSFTSGESGIDVESLPPRKRIKIYYDEHHEKEMHSGDKSCENSADSVTSEPTDSAGFENFNNFSDKAKKMMLSMGYQRGKGLGKFQQGIVEPVPSSNQRGRRGFGFVIEGLEPKENLVWDSSKEYISAKEDVRWCPVSKIDLPSLEKLTSWSVIGAPLEDIKDQTNFCHPKILEGILQGKSIFDLLSEKELHWARFRCNPYETIGKVFFQNRAALKMANLDSVFDYMFTRPVDESMRSLIHADELLYFADVCAAPGGFSEYVLWRRKSHSKGFCDAKGFGFTLKDNDFKLHDFFAAPPEYFEPHYGGNGNEGTGDVYDPQNILNFQKFVLRVTNSKGVHFMMADGGFSVEGQENIQEILSKQLYLCQFIVALAIIRENGHFVCKLFDIFTSFSVGLIYIMSKCFKHISIHKPNTSRPANSERYIVCKWKKQDVSQRAYEYLFKVNLKIRELKSQAAKEDVSEIVPYEIFKRDEKFCQYIYDSNNELGARQIIALQKIQAFSQDKNLMEEQQTEIRKECLSLWDVPDRQRVAPPRADPITKIKELLSFKISDILGNGPSELKKENISEVIHSPYDFRFVFLASNKSNSKERGFFIGMGGPNVYLWSGKLSQGVQRIDSVVHMPPDTILYGEIISELRGVGTAQKKAKVLHLIDAFILNGFNVSCFHLTERHLHLKKFAAAINKESRNEIIPVKCKPLYKLEDIDRIVGEPLLTWRILKSGGGIQKLVYLEAEGKEDEPPRFTVPTGILLLKITKDPWMMAYSRSQQRKYWYNTLLKNSTFDCLQECIASTSVSYSQSFLWHWNSKQQVVNANDNSDSSDLESLSIKDIVLYVNKMKPS